MNDSSLILRAELPADQAAIHNLHTRAFNGPQEAELVDQLRAEGFYSLSLVAEKAGELVGHILFSPLQIITDSKSLPALALAPVAVLPEHQRSGIGSALIRAGLELARQNGERIVIVLGEPAYYGRFGFRADLAAPLSSPYAGEYFMALELVPGALAGVQGEVVYAGPFGRLE